jgi:hypothetical protein
MVVISGINAKINVIPDIRGVRGARGVKITYLLNNLTKQVTQKCNSLSD